MSGVLGPARRRPGGALGRGPARRRPRARCGHPGPPGRPAGVPPQRLLPGRRVFPRNDFYRAGEASRAVEATYGLTVSAASDRTAAKRATYAETAKAQRRGQAEPVRDTLRRSVRTAAAGATTLTEFLDRLRDDGLLVRERHSERTPGELTGYA